MSKDYGHFYLVGWKDKHKMGNGRPDIRCSQPIYDLSIKAIMAALQKLPTAQGAILIAKPKLQKFIELTAPKNAALITMDIVEGEQRWKFDGVPVMVRG